VPVAGEGAAAALEGSLLHMFGLQRRPHPQRSSIVIPEFLLELYRQQSAASASASGLGHTTNLNLQGKHTQTANTVRTFTHRGFPPIYYYSLTNDDGLPGVKLYSSSCSFQCTAHLSLLTRCSLCYPALKVGSKPGRPAEASPVSASPGTPV